VEARTLLGGVSGAQLARFSQEQLEEYGLTPTMRAFITAKLLAPATEPSVDARVAQVEREKAILRDHLSRQASEAQRPLAEEEEPLVRAAGMSAASARALALTSAMAGALTGVTGFLAAEKVKKEMGRSTADESMPPTVAMPYQWASASANLGLEWVKKALEVGEKAPLVGAVFTLCLIVAQSAETALCNKTACAALGALAVRVAAALAGAEPDTLARVDGSVAALREALREAAELVGAFTKRGWLRRLASANGDAASFRRVHERVRQEMATLSFDLQVSTPVFVDETKALRALVLGRTGRSVEEGGLGALLESDAGRAALRETLGTDAQALGAELDALGSAVAAVGRATEATLHLARAKELRGAVQLSVQLTQPSKRGPPASYLQMCALPSGLGGAERRVAAFRVLTGHAVSVSLQVSEVDSTELKIKSLSRVEHVESSYTPAPNSARRAAYCCGDVLGLGWAGIAGERVDAVLFNPDDVEAGLEQPKLARLTLTLPDDAGPAGQVLTLKLRLWVSFHPAPVLGMGFAEGATVPITQTLHLAVYGQKGRSKFALRDLEDNLAKEKAGLGALSAMPVLALPLLVHRKYLRGTEEALAQQLVGWAPRLGGAE